MKKHFVLSLLTVATMSGYAQEASDEGKFEGSVRLGEQYTKTTQSDNELSVGGTIRYESASWKWISAGVGITTSYGDGDIDKQSKVNFFNSDKGNYTLLSELYLKAVLGNTEIKVGRQALETPFADSDDIGMVPNFFEAAIITNKDIADATITLVHIQSMAGVDADIPEDFTKINVNKGVQAAGINYKGIENLDLQGWYYYGEDLAKIGFLEAIYGNKVRIFDYQLGLQYVNQDYADGTKADIYGAMTTLNEKRSGIGIMAGYNETRGVSASNFWAGGPFFTSIEHTTIAEAGEDGKAFKFGIEWNASTVGIKDLIIRAERLALNRSKYSDATNTGIAVEYPYNDAIMLRAYYNDIKDDSDGDAKNLRVFADYSF